MADDLLIDHSLSKEFKYQQLIPQIKALLEGESDAIANMSNLTAALKEAFNFLWVGFYIIKSNELVLGPFQGPVACTRIAKGKGVCGTAWDKSSVIIVDDVDDFPGHIACSSQSKSEIVLPIIRNGSVIGVLDVDSEYLKHFDNVDKKYLSEILEFLSL